MSDIGELIARLEKATGHDWRLNEDIARTFGGQIRRVSKLGLNGRSRGSDRVFWPRNTVSKLAGSRIPNYTKDEMSRQATIQRLLRALPEKPV